MALPFPACNPEITADLIGQRHFDGAITNERVPLLAVANDQPHQKMHPQPQAVLRRERTSALLGVVVPENAWIPHTNSKQWHTLRAKVAAQSGAVQLVDGLFVSLGDEGCLLREVCVEAERDLPARQSSRVAQ